MPSRTRTTNSTSWETVKFLSIGGQYYAFQEQYEMKYVTGSHRESGYTSQKMATGENRLKPLDELVDIKAVANDVMGGDSVDEFKEL